MIKSIRKIPSFIVLKHIGVISECLVTPGLFMLLISPSLSSENCKLYKPKLYVQKYVDIFHIRHFH